MSRAGKRRLRDAILSVLIFTAGAFGFDVGMTMGIGSPGAQRAWHVAAVKAVLGDPDDERNQFAWDVFDVGSLIMLAVGLVATALFTLPLLVRRVATGRWTE